MMITFSTNYNIVLLASCDGFISIPPLIEVEGLGGNKCVDGQCRKRIEPLCILFSSTRDQFGIFSNVDKGEEDVVLLMDLIRHVFQGG